MMWSEKQPKYLSCSSKAIEVIDIAIVLIARQAIKMEQDEWTLPAEH